MKHFDVQNLPLNKFVEAYHDRFVQVKLLPKGFRKAIRVLVHRDELKKYKKSGCDYVYRESSLVDYPIRQNINEVIKKRIVRKSLYKLLDQERSVDPRVLLGLPAIEVESKLASESAFSEQEKLIASYNGLSLYKWLGKLEGYDTFVFRKEGKTDFWINVRYDLACDWEYVNSHNEPVKLHGQKAKMLYVHLVGQKVME